MAKNKQTELSLEELEEITGGFDKVSKDIISDVLGDYSPSTEYIGHFCYGITKPKSDWLSFKPSVLVKEDG
ncbi:hypothetical protein BX659_14514 [Orenia metallireducens]|uniref:Bacteriocin-type signal sequence-containing protein n=1 Tax=Orenia metallireducens TaxID=1413210 RepID=A0A285IIZ3_9FIRM|nr:hypothetical protein [Orenia metallireducens]PRX18138.1 hypothetical protein BX659_14514 [Orenia metallireducens]SNY46921.1 hypothetical protein SAMN06265827_14614 [Orenia metallireducens]